MTKEFVIRGALKRDALAVDLLLSEWFDWKPPRSRLNSILRAIENDELLVAETRSRLIGFIHYVLHEDIIDGGLNAFISAFYVTTLYRRKGIGTLLLKRAISYSLKRGAVGVETSTIHQRAKRLYERNHFKQTVGDIGEVFLELDIREFLSTRKQDRLKTQNNHGQHK